MKTWQKAWNKAMTGLSFLLALLLALCLFASCAPEEGTESSEKQPGVLEGIEITTIPTNTTYYVGDVFSAQGMVVTAYYDNDVSRAVTGYTWSPDGPLTMEDTVITVSYTEGEVTKTAEQEINVRRGAASVSGIEIVSPPDKTEYIAGESFDKTGMQVFTVYDDDSQGSDISDLITYAPAGSLTTEDKEITVSYKSGENVFTAKQAITVKEGSAAVSFGGGTYQGMHQIVLDPELEGTEGNGYTFSEGNSVRQWTCNGTYPDSPFGRAQSTGADKYITFTMDFSDLDDVSKVGISANMIGTRGRTHVEVSTDNQEFTTIGYSNDNGVYVTNDYCSDFKSDYMELVTSLRGNSVNDSHLYNYFWSLGEYMGESKVVYVRFGWQEEWQNGLQSPAVGADVIDHVCFYDVLNIVEPTPLDRIEITQMPDKTEYNVGERFDPAGMVVTAYFEGQEEGSVVTDYTTEPSVLTENITEVTVSYTVRNVTKSAKVPVTVNAESITEGVFGGGTYKGEHQIILGTDTDQYVTEGRALSGWNTLPGTQRFQSTAENQSITFTLDFSDVEDKSAVGCSLNLVRRRMHTVIEVSGDGTTWTELGHTDRDADNVTTVIADYNEHVTSMFGTEIKDDNLYCFYYDLSEYLADDADGIVYIRCGYDPKYTVVGDKGFGADVIGFISYYNELHFTAAE